MNYKILIIEDDLSIADLLMNHLLKYGFQCTIVHDFDNILNSFVKENPHLVLLDVNLPKYDGYFWCKKIRKVSTCPIIMISARDTDSDQVLGIESGADDYITKPFSFDVVMAKIKSQIRRKYGEYANDAYTIRRIGNTFLEIDGACIKTENRSTDLTLAELKLCSTLFKGYPHLVTRQQLFLAVWDTENFISENTLNVTVKRLREKFETIHSNLKIKALRGLGYQLEEQK